MVLLPCMREEAAPHRAGRSMSRRDNILQAMQMDRLY